MFFLFLPRRAFCPECGDTTPSRVNRISQIIFFGLAAFFLFSFFYGWGEPSLGHLILGRGGYGVLISAVLMLMLLFSPRAHLCTFCGTPFTGNLRKDRDRGSR